MRSAATLDSDSLQTLHRVRSIYTAEPSARGRRRHTSSARSLPRVGSKPDVFRSLAARREEERCEERGVNAAGLARVGTQNCVVRPIGGSRGGLTQPRCSDHRS